MAWKGSDQEVLVARLDLLNRLLEGLPGEGLLHGDIGRTLQQLGEAEKALGHYEVATRLHPELAGLFEEYGMCLEAAGRTGEAAAAFEKASGLAPEDPIPLLSLGRVLNILGRWRDAARALVAAEESDDARWPQHRVLLGQMLDEARARGETLSDSALTRE